VQWLTKPTVVGDYSPAYDLMKSAPTLIHVTQGDMGAGTYTHHLCMPAHARAHPCASTVVAMVTVCATCC
jgi:hypothetical protein